MRTAAFILALLFIPLLCRPLHPAATDSLIKSPKFDTAYIGDYKNLLSARLYFLIQDTRLVIQADEFNQIIYKPNLPFKIGIGGFYKWFGLGLAFGSPLHKQDEDKQGKTESFDLRLNLYSTSFAIEGYLHRLKGFYASNYEYPDGNNYLNPSLMVTAIGGYGYYVLNKRKFSLRSVFIQNEWQKKSAGSFMARFGFNFSRMESDSGFITPDWIRDYGSDTMRNFNEGDIFAVSLAPGYGYNLVFLKKCYLHASAFAGVQYNYMHGETTLESESYHHTVALVVSLRGAIGYVGKKFHAGFSAILPGFQPLSSGEYNFFWDPPQYRLWLGTRFDLFGKKNKKK